MPVKPAHPHVETGPVTQGKGLDSLESFIIHNWAAPTRFGIWREGAGALHAPKGSLERFLNEALTAAWQHGGAGAVITIDPPRDPFVVIRVTPESKLWTPESKYNPKHWVWKLVPLASALGVLAAALAQPLPEAEAAYLRSLREGRLREPWDAHLAAGGQPPAAR